MKKKSTRMFSIFLALFLFAGSVFQVNAEEPEEIVKETTGEEVVGQEVGEEIEEEIEEEKPAEVRGVTGETTKEAEKGKEETPAQTKEARTGCGMTVTLQIEGYGYTVEQGIQVTMPDSYKTFQDYGIEGVKEPEEPGYTVLHVMAEYCEQNYGPGTAADCIGINSGFVYEFCGMPEKSTLMFLRNRKTLEVGAQQEKVASGDLISVVDIWANGNWTIGGQYGWFADENITAEAGESFSVQLNVEPLMWGEAANPAGATVMVVNENGETVAESKTGSDGKASVVVDEPGSYTVTAQRRSSYYDTDDPYPWDLVPPHGTLTVTPGKELTDEEAVEKAGERLESQLLQVVDIDRITGDFTLPVKGSYQTMISWESSNTDFIQITGNQAKVTCPVGADQRVTLTAVITRNTQNVRSEARTEKTIAVTVVGKALFTALSIEPGTLEYEKSINAYTVYVKEGIEKLAIHGVAAEGVAVVKCTVTDQNGKQKTETKYTFSASDFSVESWLTVDGNEVVPQEIKLETLGATAGTVTITVKRGNPGKPLPDLPDIVWGAHLGDKNNNAVVDAKAPTEEGSLLWESFSNAPDNWGSIYAGTPILVNHTIYAVRNHKIEMLDAKTGKVKASTALSSQVGFYSNIIYGGGMIFVPLGNGDVQCFNAETLRSLYIMKSPAVLGEMLSVNGVLHYDNNRLYVGYSDGDWVTPAGCFAVFDTIDLDVDKEQEEVTCLWKTDNKEQSYYGSGAVTIGDKVIIGGDDGRISVRDCKGGQELSFCQIEGKIRSPLVYADGYIWTATQGKKLYKLSVSDAGGISIAAQAGLPESTNTSPVVTGGKVYVTGGSFDNGGFLAVYDRDLNLLAKEKTKYVLNTPTVTTAYNDVYLYFTENGPEGCLYAAKVTGNNKITLNKIYTPAHQQYSMSKVVIGADGTIYYANDAGYLYAVSAKKIEKPVAPEKEEGKDTPSKTIEKFTPQKQMMRVNAAGETKSVEDNIISAIQRSYEKKENSLTIKNPPEAIGAEVFKKLAEYPEFTLIFDCGAYTLSIKGVDVTSVDASLTTKLIELESTLSKEKAIKYGNYQQFMYMQKEPLPGKITVVYQLGRQFETSENLYLYDLSQNDQAQEVVVEKPYGMFVLEHGGEFILADQEAAEAEEAEKIAIPEELFPKEAEKNVTLWIYLLLGLGAGVLPGGLFAVKMVRARKRKETWEE